MLNNILLYNHAMQNGMFEIRERRKPEKVPILGILASHEIVIDRIYSHNHLESAVLEEALYHIDSQGKDYLVTSTSVDLEHLEVKEKKLFTSCVETTPESEIVFAYRKDRPHPTRFVIDREPEATNEVTIILCRDKFKPGAMVLISAFPGSNALPEPWDPQLTKPEQKQASKEFWASHALVWDPASVDLTRPFYKEERSTPYDSLSS